MSVLYGAVGSEDIFQEVEGERKIGAIVAKELLPNNIHHSVLLGSQGQQSR